MEEILNKYPLLKDKNVPRETSICLIKNTMLL